MTSVQRTTIKVVSLPIDAVKPYPGNPRINDKAVAPVAASIKEFGFQQPIVVDKDNVVIVGHTRLAAAKSLGLTEVPVTVAHNLTEEQTKAYRLADNRTNQNADWDWSLVGEELRGLIDADFDLTLTAFNQEEIKKALVWEDRGKVIRVPTEKLDALSSVGDTWVSTDGEHVIYCGKNTDAELQEILKSRPIDAIWTDPPYNLSLATGKGKVHNDTFATEQDFTSFLTDCFRSVVEVLPAGGYVFTCGHHGSYAATKQALESLGLQLKQQLIWVKTCGIAVFNTPFAKNHECIWLFTKPGPKRLSDGATAWEANKDALPLISDLEKKTKTELLEYVKQLRAGLNTTHTKLERDKWADHPTVKPVELIEGHLKRTTFPGDRVLDIFGGSGSTALTCFRIGRKSVTVELDPNYVDTTLTRLYEHHGVDFTRQDGTKWSEIWLPAKAERAKEEGGDE